MFDQSLLIDTRTRRPWTVVAGFSGQILALGIAALLPLIYTDKLQRFRVADLHIQPPTGRPARPPSDQTRPSRQSAARRLFNFNGFFAPTRIPDRIAKIDDPPDFAADAAPFIPGAISARDAMAGIPIAVTQPPPPAPSRPVETRSAVPPSAPARISGGVLAAMLIHRVVPPYPSLAKQARISGTVELLALVGKDGTVKKLDVIGGHPLLVPAAIDAVKQWIYRPTLLSGEPVEVVAPISVHFTLSQ